MTEKKQIAGHLYWKTSSRVPVCMRIPVNSGTPTGSYLAKFELDEKEMDLSLETLAQRYPCKAEEA